MEILTNQTLYKCSYCGRRMLTASGAKLHEEHYCKSAQAPRVKACNHENISTSWTPVDGGLMVPDLDSCNDCGARL